MATSKEATKLAAFLGISPDDAVRMPLIEALAAWRFDGKRQSSLKGERRQTLTTQIDKAVLGF